MNNFCLFYEIYGLLFQKPPPSEKDLHFLLGFFEGDGGCCQQTKECKKTRDFSYRITQKTVHILEIVKRVLDIGRNIYPKAAVNSPPSPFGLNSNVRGNQGGKAKTLGKPPSYRLVFGKKEQLLCILALLHGQFRFPDRHQIFSKWARDFLDQNLDLMKARLLKKLENAGLAQHGQQTNPDILYHCAAKAKLCTPEEQRWYHALLKVNQSSTWIPTFSPIRTDDAWLSGFIEAEGHFRCQFSRRPHLKRGYSIDLGIEFRQNNAQDQFTLLKARFGGHLRQEGESWQLRISSQKSLLELQEYLTRYPLRGRKLICQSRWMRAFSLREKNPVLPVEGTLEYQKFLRLLKTVNLKIL